MTATRNFAVDAAKKYLQSIVFVDDEIYLDVSGRPKEINIELPGMPSPFKAQKKLAPSSGDEKKAATSSESTELAPAVPAKGAVAVEPPTAPPYHPKQLVESFAREGMVCALYEPAKGFKTDVTSELFTLCERADVVILDWDLYGEDGRNVLPLIANLVSQSQTSVPHQVRLCVIYTTKPNLEQVASQIFDHLRKENLEVQPVKQTSLLAGASKIIVLGKPNSVGRGKDIRAAAEVAESDLASRIIEEFAAMHEGILPSLALHGMSSIRMNSKKILDKFRPEMDGAFLLHRALLLANEDAFIQLPELVAEEALAVMLDNQVPMAKTAELVKDVVAKMALKDIIWDLKEGRPAVKPGELAGRFLVGGMKDIVEDYKRPKKGMNLDQLHAAMGCGETNADKRLATLFNLRTLYVKEKDLTFGTVVRWQEVDETISYAVCLMPVCDSIRLSDNKQYAFPFWKLITANSGAMSRGIVVPCRDGTFVELFALGKPRDNLWLDTFVAGNGGTVVAELQGDSMYFKGAGKKLEWIAQLKPAHAQRVAQDIGQSLSRIGVVEAEWLRTKSEGREG